MGLGDLRGGLSVRAALGAIAAQSGALQYCDCHRGAGHCGLVMVAEPAECVRKTKEAASTERCLFSFPKLNLPGTEGVADGSAQASNVARIELGIVMDQIEVGLRPHEKAPPKVVADAAAN